jgi:hypothetical protein
MSFQKELCPIELLVTQSRRQDILLVDFMELWRNAKQKMAVTDEAMHK